MARPVEARDEPERNRVGYGALRGPRDARRSLLERVWARSGPTLAFSAKPTAHFKLVARSEQKAAWVEQYDAIKPEHDALVAELKETYLEVVTKMVDLLSRIRAFDARVQAVMQAKPFPEAGEPDDSRRLLPIECAARGVSGFGPNDLSLNRHLVLPDFTERGKKSWPPDEVCRSARCSQSK